jgi:hypothetical protein
MNMRRGNGFFQDWWSDFAIPVLMSLNRPSNSRKRFREASHASNAAARQFVDCTCRGFCLSPSQTIPTVLENTRDGPDNPATIRPYSLYHLQYGTKSIRTGSVLISQSYFSKSSVRIVIGCIGGSARTMYEYFWTPYCTFSFFRQCCHLLGADLSHGCTVFLSSSRVLGHLA